jgi:hypothetical protein
MATLRRIGIGALCLLVAGGCSADAPAASGNAETSATARVESPRASPLPQPTRSSGFEPGDVAAALAGRPVAALGAGGIDVVMRIDADGFRLPAGERLLDIHGDRVLSAASDLGDAGARLVVRNLAGAVIREIATGMQVPQVGIVRDEDVYFAGVDLGEGAARFDLAMDRGAWVALGDARPVPLVAAEEGLAVYTAIERSPDGHSVGIWRCAERCATILIGPDGAVDEVPRPGLIVLTNDVALLIGAFRDVTAYAIDGGAELWRAETEGIYYGRYATADGRRIVLSALEPAGAGGASTDQLRIERLDSLTGVVGPTVLVSTATELLWVAPSLSTDRYVALLDTVLPSTETGPHAVRVVDLELGALLDVELRLGAVP